MIAKPVPVRIGGVSVQSAQYSEQRNPNFSPAEDVPHKTALDLNVRADYGWAGDRVIVLLVHAGIKTPNAPMLVDCQLSIRVAFERGEKASQAHLWAFVKEAGMRVAFPFIRTHIATLTGMGSLGSLLIEPLMLGLEESPVSP